MVGLKHQNDLVLFLERLRNWFFSSIEKPNETLNGILDSLQKKEKMNEKHSKFLLLKNLENYKFSLPTLKITSFQEILKSIIMPTNVYRLVFIDGYFSEYLSDKNIGFWKIKKLKRSSDIFLSNPIQPEFLHVLIDYFSKEKIKIYLPLRSVSKKPLYILHINQGSKEKNVLNIIQNCREIFLEEQSEGFIIEHFIDSSSLEEKYFLGSKNVFYVQKESKLKYIQIFSQNKGHQVSYNDFHMEQNAITDINVISLNSQTLIDQINVKFNGKTAKFFNHGLSIAYKNSMNAIQNYVEHNTKNCISKQTHKIIALDNGIGIFDGLVKINQYAKKSCANMTSNNLILNKHSKIYSQPKLEIYIDEVKCSHAITMGKIDESQIFYFLSRGIKYKEAKKIILFSFVFSIIETIHHTEIKNIILNNIKKIVQ